MLNKTKTLLLTVFAMLAMATGVNATDLRISHTPKMTTINPLKYLVISLLPEYAAKNGVKDLQITLVNTNDANDANSGLLAKKIDIITSGSQGYNLLYAKEPTKPKLLTGWNNFDMWLLCANPNIKTLDDITPSTKIALKSLNAGHHLMLRQFAAEKYGVENQDKFTPNIIVMPREQSFAILQGENPTVDCTITDTPFQNDLLRSGKTHLIAKPNNKTSFQFANVSYTTSDWVKENPGLAKAWVEAVKEAIKIYNSDPKAAAETFISLEKMTDVTAEDIIKIKKENNDTYNASLNTTLGTLNLMYKLKIIKDNAPDTISDADKAFDSSLIKKN